MKKTFFFCFLLNVFLGINCFSQTQVPDSLTYKYYPSPEDPVQNIGDAYSNLESTLLADIDWLNYTPIDENHEMRNEKSRFVLMWMSGNPTVSVQIDDRIITFLGADPAILMAYMMGWTKYSVEHDYSNDQIECTVAGITNAVNFYNRNRKFLRKDKELEKYKKMVEKRTLHRHIADILTRPNTENSVTLK